MQGKQPYEAPRVHMRALARLQQLHEEISSGRVRDHRVATRSRRRPWRSVPLSSSIFLWTQSHISTIKRPSV